MNVHNLGQMEKGTAFFPPCSQQGEQGETDLAGLQQVKQGRSKYKNSPSDLLHMKSETLASLLPAGGALCLVYLYKSDGPLCEGRK